MVISPFLESTAVRLVLQGGGEHGWPVRKPIRGQIQIRRAQLVDTDVRNAVIESFCHTSDCSGLVRSAWDAGIGSGALYERLRNEQMNVLYSAAYLARLRGEHPAGTGWNAIYSERTDIGEWNIDPDSLKEFVASRTYYAYLDQP